MSDSSRGTPEPPPNADGDERSGPGRDDRPMSILSACGWAFGITFLFLWLLSVLVLLHRGPPIDFISAVGCQAIAYLLGLFAVMQVHAPRASIREFLGVRPAHPLFYPLALTLGVALEGPISAVYRAIELRWPSSSPPEDDLVRVLADAGTAHRIVLGLGLVVIGPAIEEIVFRGALTRPLRRRYGVSAVVVTTAVLFALSHVEPKKFLPIGIFGLALGIVRAASGSLLPSFVLHVTYNAVQFFAILGSIMGGAVAETGPVAAAVALVGDAPLPVWILVVSSSVALGLIALACLLGSRSEGTLRARERDTA